MRKFDTFVNFMDSVVRGTEFNYIRAPIFHKTSVAGSAGSRQHRLNTGNGGNRFRESAGQECALSKKRFRAFLPRDGIVKTKSAADGFDLFF